MAGIKHCAFYGCMSKKSDEGGMVSFFTLPPDEERRKKWLEIMDRTDLNKPNLNPKSYVICVKHFDKSSLIFIPRLKSDTIPTKVVHELKPCDLATLTEDSILPIKADSCSVYVQTDEKDTLSVNPQTTTTMKLSKTNEEKGVEKPKTSNARKRTHVSNTDNIGEVTKKSRHDVDDIEIDYDNIDKFGEQIAFLLKRIPRQLCRELQDSIVTLVKTETEKYESKTKSNATEVEMLISTNIKQEAEECTTEDELENMSDEDEIPDETTQATQHTETQRKTAPSTSKIKKFPKPMTLPMTLVGSMDCVKHEVLDAGESSNITVQEQYNKATISGNVDCVNKEVPDPEESRNITVEEEYNKATTSELTLSDPLETRIKIEIDETSWLKQL